jgi:AraC family transcriptional regulator, regulatory protein of adaptative response / methylated-DNA-[protein]-cysteine methyltransferase
MTSDQDYRRVAAAIRHLQENRESQPGLAAVAAVMRLSESRAQRVFTALAGISPKRFLQHLNGLHADRLLQAGGTVLDAAWGAGLSGPGRLHDLMVGVHAATPGEVASGGAGMTVRWSVQPTPFGNCLIAVTDRGICGMHFLDPMTADEALVDVRRRWPNAHYMESVDEGASIIRRAFTRRVGDQASPDTSEAAAALPLAVLVTGTNFQLQVWRALLRIPAGHAVTYADIARTIGAPAASRAVGAAVGRNPVALLIPCHRVIRADGGLGGYHWGTDRKQALLAWESATD